ncbi:hypothetical protein GCM10020221_12790 [Streptomyces thioluteus]|uniref:Uncharacterized protein n=1 Tax=Streptomyces thioluteus TaxID=66431 RepID=A0ABP6J2J5_STRTU
MPKYSSSEPASITSIRGTTSRMPAGGPSAQISSGGRKPMPMMTSPAPTPALAAAVPFQGPGDGHLEEVATAPAPSSTPAAPSQPDACRAPAGSSRQSWFSTVNMPVVARENSRNRRLPKTSSQSPRTVVLRAAVGGSRSGRTRAWPTVISP